MEVRRLRARIAELHAASFAAASAALVRWLVASRSCSATSAMTPTVMRLALRHVDRSEVDAGIAQAEQEHRIAAQAIEAADDQLRTVEPARRERPMRAPGGYDGLAALDLDDLLDELASCRR